MFWWTSILVILALLSSSVHSELLVTTTSGQVRGQTVSSPTGDKVNVYMGIPYAEPPLGNLRFKHPKEIRPWSRVFDATREPFTCFQKPMPLENVLPDIIPMVPHTERNEDCLKLNIWVPNRKDDTLYPIMVWIHGGGHARGGITSPVFNGTIMAAEEKVMIAMMNYRLASLGNLYLDHPDIPGNAGLYDQLLALKWIKENAKAFGGDPDSITLFGQSSGGASVGNHLMSPLSSPLFHRAIMSSGSPTAEWATIDREEAISRSMFLARNIGCSTENITKLVECFYAADAADIIGSEFQIGFDYVYIHVPVVDGLMVPDMPRKLLKLGHFSNVSLMTGNVKDEATMFLAYLEPTIYPLKENFTNIGRHARWLMNKFKWDTVTQDMAEFLYSNTLGTKEEDEVSFLPISRASADFQFNCPVTEFDIAYSAAGNKVFKYYLVHRASIVKLPKWLGVYHTQDIQYYFGAPLRDGSTYTEEEILMSRRMMRYWANFARTGDPNNSPKTTKDLDGVDTHWPAYTLEGKEYLVMAPNCTSVGHGLFEKYCLFWRELRQKLGQLCQKSSEKNAAL